MTSQTNDVRHGISRRHLEQLIAELDKKPMEMRTASELIARAGITGDTWLAQCLLYESEAMVWAAWEA